MSTFTHDASGKHHLSEASIVSALNLEKPGLYVSQHIERDQLSLKIKIDFALFPKWLFFYLNFSAKIFEIGHCVLEMWQFY